MSGQDIDSRCYGYMEAEAQLKRLRLYAKRFTALMNCRRQYICCYDSVPECFMVDPSEDRDVEMLACRFDDYQQYGPDHEQTDAAIVGKVRKTLLSIPLGGSTQQIPGLTIWCVRKE